MFSTIGVIGLGQMGGSLLRRLVSSGYVSPQNVIAADADAQKVKALTDALGVRAGTNEQAAACELCVLAVKPQQYTDVLPSIAPALEASDALLASIAPGYTLARLEAALGYPARIVRLMPNTPALVGEGMTATCKNERASKEALGALCSLLACLGRVEVVQETLMDTVVGIAGSAPAYVFMLMDAMRIAAIRGGMQKDQASRMIAQTVLGAAKLALETGKTPSELCDMVMSPGGTTVEAVCKLEEKGFRDALIGAVGACIKKSGSM